MAKKTKAAKTDDTTSSNGTKEAKASDVKSCISRIEALNDEKESARGAFMNKCSKINDRISSVVDEGSRKGLPSKVVRACVRVRAKLQKARDEIAKLEAEEARLVEEFLRKNDDPNDLPLFSASASIPIRARAGEESAAALH
jgi:uncharacterized protein (UPF0335 family)